MRKAVQAGISGSTRAKHIFSPEYVGDPMMMCRCYCGCGHLTFLYLAHQHVGQAALMREINRNFMEQYKVKRQYWIPKVIFGLNRNVRL